MTLQDGGERQSDVRPHLRARLEPASEQHQGVFDAHGQEVEGFGRGVREVLVVVGHEQIALAMNGSGDNVAVVGVGKIEAVNEESNPATAAWGNARCSTSQR